MDRMGRWTRMSQHITLDSAVSAEGSSKPCRRALYKLTVGTANQLTPLRHGVLSGPVSRALI
jgi:hypothetical protein